MRKINEIFYSLQGEGHHAGYPSVFIRFSGCNLSCPFCDTEHSEGVYMSDDDIFHAVNLYTASWIVLTGGEPAMHIDSDFIKMLKKATGKKIAIETNGTLPVPPEIDWITVSPKHGICGDSEADTAADNTEENADHTMANTPAATNGEVVIPYANEIKVIDLGQDLEGYFDMPCRGENTLMYLQPCYVEDKAERESNRLRTLSRVLADPRWTLSVQLHRFLGIP